MNYERTLLMAERFDTLVEIEGYDEKQAMQIAYLDTLLNYNENVVA